ncbi:hypothetical protein Bca52824_021882 [Brassica carinata]|uniref:Uncharacterized protein n=1 Tax=Brassica carinata TaxID=52824 RepID=A0A8X7VF66_BRACI|nr:hypothetical protein Bca52824_021882 [Brassica carinata]
MQFLTALSTPLIRVAGWFDLSPCLLPFLSFQTADRRVELIVWSVRILTILSQSFV